MAAVESALLFSSSPTLSSSPKLYIFSKSTVLNLRIRSFYPSLSRNLPLCPGGGHSRRLVSALCSVAEEETSLEEKTDGTQNTNVKKKLFVFNLPWSMSVNDISELFGQCGTVSDVEIIKQKDGKNRGFAFITMSSGEEAQAAVDKFDAYQVSGRIIRVSFSRRFKKPRPAPTPPPPPGSRETRHKLYISNLAWKARSTHLRDFFAAADLNPVSVKVVFDTPEGRAAGYGFVSFATREEAETAISKLNGKELMGRPISLKFSVRTASESEDEDGAKDGTSQEEPTE
ncbi:PREDICTED: 33 kDa ribonucleoprotein, chloroplastic [Tarenaya hassleriana]|uniref:33 kDa ribonucleoprotein, chloroplastic n=1 Tax=Tarenaya hassleriana TaxID=28532 RepID=UPI00053C86A2|nr:PREDICTED: 33 kDa ribonucleoprotein, chloroplastic [Tarenaya hassleriana]